MHHLVDDRCVWYTKRVGNFVVLIFWYYIRTQMTYSPVRRETVIGKWLDQ